MMDSESTDRGPAGGVAALGERARVVGFGLAGALVRVAESPDAVRAAWSALPGDVAVVVLTPAAAEALGAERARGWPVTVVMPP
jgi:vacuolar-type H+-ATPase subunit F/Vma7